MSNNFFTACLNLFQAVPEGYGESPQLIKEYGIYVVPNAVWAIDDIKAWAETKFSTSEALNSTLFQTWKNVQESTDEELLSTTLMHYMGTYGMESLGLPQIVYIPKDLLRLPEAAPIHVIGAIHFDVLKDKVRTILESPIAMKQETIEDALTIWFDLILDEETQDLCVSNLETQVLIADRTGNLPTEGDFLFRYLLFKATGKTLAVKDKQTLGLISDSSYKLPQLSEKQMVSLAKSFNRRKEYWLAFKAANKGANSPTINRISKLSKKHHVALKPNVLLTLTSKEWSIEDVSLASSKATTPQLVRAINALRFYQLDNQHRLYKIRNGKSFIREKQGGSFSGWCEPILLSELRLRLAGKSISCPSSYSLAFPTSEKNFIGSIPFGSSYTFPEESFPLIGINWERRMDLDLKAEGITTTIGWNTYYKDGSFFFSGDVTCGPGCGPGAEWIISTDNSKKEEVVMLSVALFSRYIEPKDAEFKFVLASSDAEKVERNYTCDPSQVLSSIPTQMSQRHMCLGFLISKQFFFLGRGMSESNVSSLNEGFNAASHLTATTMLQLNEVITVEEGENLPTLDDLLSLVS